MALEQRKDIFGIHSITARDPDTKKFLGTAKIIGNASVNNTGEVIELEGGSSPFPWAAEDGKISGEIALSLKEFPNWLWEAFAGVKMTENDAEANAAVSKTLTNAYGTSVQKATTGIVSVGVKAGSESDVKTASYTIVAASATTVNIYADTDVDFGQGTKKVFADESLKINDAPITITTGGAISIPGYGLELTGGSGVIAMTVGDTAYFETRAANTGSESAIVGSTTSKYKEVELIIAAARKRNKELVKITVFRAKAIGLPLPMTSREFSTAEITAKGIYDSVNDGVYKIERIRTVN